MAGKGFQDAEGKELSMLAAGLLDWAASWDRRALLGVIAALAINWFGDSLDRTLARPGAMNGFM